MNHYSTVTLVLVGFFFFYNKDGGYLLHTMSYVTVNSQYISIDCISVLSWKVHTNNTVTIINNNANRGK